jgi:hypothetical protein
MTRKPPALEQAKRLADELVNQLGAVRRDLAASELQRAELARRLRVCEAEVAELTGRPREGADESSGLDPGELRQAITAARGDRGRRPRWADHLLGPSAPRPRAAAAPITSTHS